MTKDQALTSLLRKRKALLPDEVNIIVSTIEEFGSKLDHTQRQRMVECTRHLGRDGARIRNALREFDPDIMP